MASKRNSEGYYDPTAYEALVKIEREAKRTSTYRPLVYVCSPLSGDIAANQENARRYCRSVVERGGIPLAPHLLFPQFMDDIPTICPRSAPSMPVPGGGSSWCRSTPGSPGTATSRTTPSTSTRTPDPPSSPG